MSSNRRVRVYEAADGWRWQLWSSSDITADGGQGYEDRAECIRMARESTPEGTPIEIEGDE